MQPVLLVLALQSAGSPIELSNSPWRQCIEAAARRYAVLDEPAETVATGALAGCRDHLVQIRQRVESNNPRARPDMDRMMADLENRWRQRLIRLVLDERLRRRPG